MRHLGILLALPLLLVACGGSDPGQDVMPDGIGDVTYDAVGDTVVADQGTDVAVPDQGTDESDPDMTEEVQAEVVEDVLQDAGSDTVADATPNFDEIVQPYPPRELPFTFTRPAEGEPLSAQEVTDFTKKVAGAYKDVGFFRWLLRTSTGVDATSGREGYLSWYNDVVAVKSGDTVTFSHRGGEHNMWIPGSIVLASVMNAYLLTGDWEMARLTEQYCKGLTAVVKGFVFDENDTETALMARAILPFDHSFTLDADFWKDDGRKKVVEFHEAQKIEDGWNAHTFNWPTNPTWGDIWVTNMRSKDDVRAISRTVTWLPYVVTDAADEWVRTACQETLDTMVAFHADIVDNDYFIRTKGVDGVAYRIPCDDQDLGSYSCYIEMDERNECCARLSADMIAYGERRTNDCGTCTGSIYDQFASVAHYYNMPIIWDYHMAGVGTSLLKRQYRDAWHALRGLAERIDSYMHPTEDVPNTDNHNWDSDMAVLLVQAASMGLPLTDMEARHVQKHFSAAADYFKSWTNWDLWALEDGQYGVRPPDNDQAVDSEAFAILFEYCNSPFKNPAGAAFVDCAVLADPSSW
ncbi:MAG TPA: hypothetical protein PKH54_12510 [Myxococcota bacterium]|nr:hypothetical protein [Myxococcota bacterium]HOA14422.1 hypothetical protein [Myxococcota bacterium]HOD00761.1 hypothetical protein [Myxococcota bacterium]HOH77667.1 hypothetical protein [Myxococcota bacterium]